MKDKIEKAIRETLVIENKQSIHIAVERIMKLISENQTKQQIDGNNI